MVRPPMGGRIDEVVSSEGGGGRTGPQEIREEVEVEVEREMGDSAAERRSGKG